MTMNIAGPGALIVAKAHKIWERTSNDDRVRDKDALDVYRLLQAIPTDDLAARSSPPPTEPYAHHLDQRPPGSALTGRGRVTCVSSSIRLHHDHQG
ncbi:MAG: hypothetical protein R2713_14810 [Ilumatobacteraceae bacterium]